MVLLAAALGSFGLSMVRISLSPAFVAGLQQVPGLGALPAACVNGGLAAYSGLALAVGGTPTVNTACLSRIQDAGDANLGAQPLVLLAVLAILGAAAAAGWGVRGQRVATGTLSTLAIALLVVSTPGLAGTFAGHFGHPATTITSGPETGLWVVTGLLLLVELAQLGSTGVGWARLALAPLEDLDPAPRGRASARDRSRRR